VIKKNFLPKSFPGILLAKTPRSMLSGDENIE
jgi:hypothetical protein